MVTQSLEREPIERLHELLNEITDMHVALGTLSHDKGEKEGCASAIEELHRQLDARLSKALDILDTGKVDAELD